MTDEFMTPAPTKAMTDDQGMPDLQKLVVYCRERYLEATGETHDPKNPDHGGYRHISPADWTAWDAANEEFQRRRRIGLHQLPQNQQPRKRA
jgi:hypothetical protein